MIDSLNTFATWVFGAITSVWNFAINNQFMQFFLAIYILYWLVDEYRKYAGK